MSSKDKTLPPIAAKKVKGNYYEKILPAVELGLPNPTAGFLLVRFSGFRPRDEEANFISVYILIVFADDLFFNFLCWQI